MFCDAAQRVAYELYKKDYCIAPEWNEIKVAADNVVLSDDERKKIKPMERIKMVHGPEARMMMETLYKLFRHKTITGKF
jgi:type I restriction enzyme R subunit